MFDTIQECVPDWNNSYIASNTTTENINDLLEYYRKLELQEAKRNDNFRMNTRYGRYGAAYNMVGLLLF
jgi:hypothetical protein